MFMHDIIKIDYVNLGYLPNYPYYLISDEEMFGAFMGNSQCVFDDYYPCPSEDLSEQYAELKDYIQNYINKYLAKEVETIPDWIYSYMLRIPTTFESDSADIMYLYKLTDIEYDGPITDFSSDLAEECYAISSDWLQRLASRQVDRPATMFGECHVIKSLRLREANALVGG